MAEKERKPDRRVVKTKKAIRNAFAKLLCEKDIDKITIKDIADTADINRKTFYNYYSGVYQIIDEIEDEIVERFDATTQDMDTDEFLKNPYGALNRLTETMYKDLDFYGYLMQMNANVSLVSKLVDLLKEKTKETILSKVNCDAEKLSIVIEYVITGMIAGYRSWFNSDKKLSLEEVSDVLGHLSYEGVTPFLKEYITE